MAHIVATPTRQVRWRPRHWSAYIWHHIEKNLYTKRESARVCCTIWTTYSLQRTTGPMVFIRCGIKFRIQDFDSPDNLLPFRTHFLCYLLYYTSHDFVCIILCRSWYRFASPFYYHFTGDFTIGSARMKQHKYRLLIGWIHLATCCSNRPIGHSMILLWIWVCKFRAYLINDRLNIFIKLALCENYIALFSLCLWIYAYMLNCYILLLQVR